MTDRQVAIVGYGLAGRWFHAPLIAATDGLRIATIVTSDAGRAAQARADHPGVAVVDRVDAVWEGRLPDLLVVATSNDVHAATAAAGIDRGVAVVVDKPMAVSVPEAEDLLARAQARNVLLTVFQNRRWDTDHLTLCRLLAEGALGEVVRYESRFERWRPESDPGAWRESTPPERGGGQLLDLGSHVIDQALVLLGPVDRVYGEVQSRRGLPGDDDVFLALQHGSGAISHLHASAVTPAGGHRLRVQGTQAGFVVAGLDPQEDALREGRHPGDPGWGECAEWARGRLVAGDQSIPVPAVPGDWPRFYAGVEQALRGDAPAPVDPADAVAVLRVIEAARQSASEHRLVELPR